MALDYYIKVAERTIPGISGGATKLSKGEMSPVL